MTSNFIRAQRKGSSYTYTFIGNNESLCVHRSIPPLIISYILIPNFRAWLFHCHFLFHVAIGMNLVIHVGTQSDLPPVPPNFPTCGHHLPPIQSPSPYKHETDFFSFKWFKAQHIWCVCCVRVCADAASTLWSEEISSNVSASNVCVTTCHKKLKCAIVK